MGGGGGDGFVRHVTYAPFLLAQGAAVVAEITSETGTRTETAGTVTATATEAEAGTVIDHLRVTGVALRANGNEARRARGSARGHSHRTACKVRRRIRVRRCVGA